MQFDTNLCRRIQAIIKVRPVDQVDKRFEEKINELSQLREAIAAPSFEYKETGHKSALSITVGRRSLLELWYVPYSCAISPLTKMNGLGLLLCNTLISSRVDQELEFFCSTSPTTLLVVLNSCILLIETSKVCNST